MDPTGTLGLLLLPWLVMGTAMGDVTQDRPGIARPIQDLLFRLGCLPARQGGLPAPALSLPAFPRPLPGTGHSCPSMHFLSLEGPLCSEAAGTELPEDRTPGGPNSPGDLSLPGDVADLFLSL